MHLHGDCCKINADCYLLTYILLCVSPTGECIKREKLGRWE